MENKDELGLELGVEVEDVKEEEGVELGLDFGDLGAKDPENTENRYIPLEEAMEEPEEEPILDENNEMEEAIYDMEEPIEEEEEAIEIYDGEEYVLESNNYKNLENTETEEELELVETGESKNLENSEDTDWFDSEGEEGEEDFYGDYYEGIEDEFEDTKLVFYDINGNPVNARKDGSIRLEYIPITEIVIPERVRRDPRDLSKLESSISRFEQISPIHVTPYGDSKFLLVDGFRRINALINIGEDVVLAIVDETISPHAVRPFESLINNKLNYNYAEKFSAGKFFEERQEGFSYDTIEDIVGLKSGEYLKMLFVEGNKNNYPEIYEKVMLEKMTPEQAERKILKEEEKADDEVARESLEATESEEQVQSRDRESESPYSSQNKEERQPLDSTLKTAVITRDSGVCQACGEGIGEPEVSQLMKIHHIVPVELFGADRMSNLITLCANCHEKVHYYDEGRYIPEGDILKVRRNLVVLGNMIQELRDRAQENGNVPIEGVEYYKDSPYEVYLGSSYQSDFVEGVVDNADNTTLGEVKKVYPRRDRPKLRNTKKDFEELRGGNTD